MGNLALITLHEYGNRRQSQAFGGHRQRDKLPARHTEFSHLLIRASRRWRDDAMGQARSGALVLSGRREAEWLYRPLAVQSVVLLRCSTRSAAEPDKAREALVAMSSLRSAQLSTSRIAFKPRGSSFRKHAPRGSTPIPRFEAIISDMASKLRT